MNFNGSVRDLIRGLSLTGGIYG